MQDIANIEIEALIYENLNQQKLAAKKQKVITLFLKTRDRLYWFSIPL